MQNKIKEVLEEYCTCSNIYYNMKNKLFPHIKCQLSEDSVKVIGLLENFQNQLIFTHVVINVFYKPEKLEMFFKSLE